MLKKIVSGVIYWLNVIAVTFIIWIWILVLIRPDLAIKAVEWFEGIVATLGYWNYLIIFCSSMLESIPVIWMILPWQNIMLIVWWFFGKTQLLSTIWISVLGSILWGFIWYYMWKHYWEGFFTKYGKWFSLGETELKYVKILMEKYGWWLIVLGKFHPLTRSFLPFIAGTWEMSMWRFLLYNIVGSLFWATAMIILWVVFVTYYEIILKYIGYLFTLVFLAILVYMYLFKREALMKYWQEKTEELERSQK